MISKFGDLRLDQRLDKIMEDLRDIPRANLPQVLTSWSKLKAGYRFLNNKRVTHEGILESESEATLARLRAEAGDLVLAVQDTTSFNFARRPALSGLGVLDDNKTPGFFAHTTLAVSEQGVPLGLFGQQVWSRSQRPGDEPDNHRGKPISEKESMKWLNGLPPAVVAGKRVVTVGDRESDVYELFQVAYENDQDFIVRSAQNRRRDAAPRLYDQLRELAPAATYSLTVQRQVNQHEREARVELRYTTVTLLPPPRPGASQVVPLQARQVQVVEVREIDHPPTLKDPIHWILLTTLPVDSLADAYRIVRYYTYRWLVERFHFVLKSGGCDFEASQLRTVEALHRLLALCSRIAWRLLWLTYQARQTPDAPATLALTEPEWQALTAFTSPDHKPAIVPPTLAQAVRLIASLGGFIGRTSDGDPGVKTLWRGWQRFQDIVDAWTFFHPPPRDVGNV